MKKLKFLPSILMLVLSVAVLALGVYAANPSTSTVTGSIKVNASAYPIAIECLIDGEVIEEHSILRSGITWTEGLSNLTFNTDKALTVNQVHPRQITLRITNLSNVALGAFFLKDDEEIATEYASDENATAFNEDGLVTGYGVDIAEDIVDSSGTTIANAYMSSYAYLAPSTSGNETDTVDMNITMALADIFYEEKSANFTFNLYVEEYVPNVYVEYNAGLLDDCLYSTDMLVKLDTTCESFVHNHTNAKYLVIPSGLNTSSLGFFAGPINCVGAFIGASYWEFMFLNKLEMVSFANCETGMGYGFSGKSTLKVVHLSNTITQITSEMFKNCTNLISVNISNSVKSIGANAFEGCSSLSNIVLPSGVQTISEYAFIGCSSITSIYIPSSVENIYDSAMQGPFLNCSSLSTIYVSFKNESSRPLGWFDGWNMVAVDEGGNPSEYAIVKYGYTYEEYLAEVRG